MTSGLKYQLFYRCHIVGEAISVLCLCFVGGTRAAAWQHVNGRDNMAEQPR